MTEYGRPEKYGAGAPAECEGADAGAGSLVTGGSLISPRAQEFGYWTA